MGVWEPEPQHAGVRSEDHHYILWEYRIPDSRRIVSSVSAEFRNAYQEAHET
jgi:hypothetical protein